MAAPIDYRIDFSNLNINELNNVVEPINWRFHAGNMISFVNDEAEPLLQGDFMTRKEIYDALG